MSRVARVTVRELCPGEGKAEPPILTSRLFGKRVGILYTTIGFGGHYGVLRQNKSDLPDSFSSDVQGKLY